ncbi:MAG: ABC transporter ATP-binding protein [Burkholderiaceae bacterium]
MIETHDLQRSYRLRTGLRSSRWLHAVRGVSVTVRAHEALGIAGESGCGKSTLARLMLGLERPDGGRISLAGQPLGTMHAQQIARIVQPVFQDPAGSLNPRKTVEQNIRLPLDALGIGSAAERSARVLELLGQVGLPARYRQSHPGQLSGGQAQRVAIARALAPRPALLVCDEPTSALDTSVQAQILNLLLAMRRDLGVGLVFITHDLVVLRRLCDRVAVMYLGEVVETGATAEVMARPRHPYTRMLLRSALTPDPSLPLPPAEPGGAITPDPTMIAQGCPFRPRCDRADDQCVREAPRLRSFGAVEVACHHAQAQMAASID